MAQNQQSDITFPTLIFWLETTHTASSNNDPPDSEIENSKFQSEHVFSGVGNVMVPLHNFPHSLNLP